MSPKRLDLGERALAVGAELIARAGVVQEELVEIAVELTALNEQRELEIAHLEEDALGEHLLEEVRAGGGRAVDRLLDRDGRRADTGCADERPGEVRGVEDGRGNHAVSLASLGGREVIAHDVTLDVLDL